MHPEALERLVALAARHTGFRKEAIHAEAVRRAVQALPEVEAARLLQGSGEPSPGVLERILDAVCVPETFFFRHPEHFHLLEADILPQLELGPGEPLRAWSAGCATGEEAYSLAAALRPWAARQGRSLEVLGTDLLERNVLRAREGIYGKWSVRQSAPLLFPTLDEAPGGQRVRPELRRVTRFERHNLLHGPPAAEPFHVVFCRNVLVYLDPAPARQVVQNLCAALAPSGAVIFAHMDLDGAPPGFGRFGPPDSSAFRRAAHPAAPERSAPAPRSVPAPLRAAVPDPARAHGEALLALERGDLPAADRLWAQLLREAPDYLPALLQRALVLERLGEREAAVDLMEGIRQRTRSLPAETQVSGAGETRVSFYRNAATAFLDRHRRIR
jgi:chemotaxis protein methyltransferase CheR